MIYTVTLNPSIDYIIYVHDLKLGNLNRMDADLKLPGGKGINVSRILKRMGITSTALGFLGGFSGGFIDTWLHKEGILCQFTSTSKDTRINIKLKADMETEINGLGPTITQAEIASFKASLSQIKKEDIVVLSGSVPTCLRAGFYEELIQLIKERDATFVIDTTGEDLQTALSYHPFLVKPNIHELAELYHTQFHSIEEIVPYGKKLLDDGATYAIVSMAKDGALLFTGNAIYQSNALKRPLKNSVGAGDSLLAGFLGMYEKTQDPLHAFTWGIACGSATAFSIDLATKEFMAELQPEVTIKKL